MAVDISISLLVLEGPVDAGFVTQDRPANTRKMIICGHSAYESRHLSAEDRNLGEGDFLH
jgi:hypothetical protein